MGGKLASKWEGPFFVNHSLNQVYHPVMASGAKTLTPMKGANGARTPTLTTNKRQISKKRPHRTLAPIKGKFLKRGHTLLVIYRPIMFT